MGLFSARANRHQGDLTEMISRLTEHMLLLYLIIIALVLCNKIVVISM